MGNTLDGENNLYTGWPRVTKIEIEYTESQMSDGDVFDIEKKEVGRCRATL